MSVIHLSPEVLAANPGRMTEEAEAYQRRRAQFSQRLDGLLELAEIEPPLEPEDAAILLNMCMGDIPQTDDEGERRFVILTPDIIGRTQHEIVLNHLFNVLRGKIPNDLL